MENREKIKDRQPEETVGDAIRASYGRIARGESHGCGCGCGPGGETFGSLKRYAEDLGYTAQELDRLPDGANLGLGCGNPRVLANFRAGEKVLDLGSGAGVDSFNAAREVGDNGYVIGVDMTPEMVSKSRKNAQNSGAANVEFRLGEIENLPVADNEIDVVISNCVINLSSEKRRVYAEMFRCLKPGGRLAISDIVALQELPQRLLNDLKMITACVGGAEQIGGIEAMIRELGFQDIRVEPMDGAKKIIASWFPELGLDKWITSASITAIKPLIR